MALTAALAASAAAQVVAALAAVLVTAGEVALFAWVTTALGTLCLHALRVELPRDEEHLLVSAGVGAIAIEALLFFAEASGHVRGGVLAVMTAAAIIAVAGYGDVLRRTRAVAARVSPWASPPPVSPTTTSAGMPLATPPKTATASSPGRAFRRATATERVLAVATFFVIAVEFLAAMAPLTGSDALHYHFAVPKVILARGFHPDFFLSHSFFCGQSHLLILLGLALGSEKLAMGLLFLGGILAAASAACLTSRWAGRAWCWATALVFLVTPVVFWQIATAGAPDIWMAFFATAAVIVVARAREMNLIEGGVGVAAVAGILAGGIAGTKYTGCIVAASVALAFIVETRSARNTIVFGLSALAAGIWPYARNFVWTGDPVFPFMMQRLHPERVNATALAGYLADTGATQARSFGMILKFPFFAWIDVTHLGFWQFFGPLVLAFAPLTIRAVRNTPVWRAALIVWIFSAAGIGWSSGMTRFLLPVFPIAIAAAMAGAAALGEAQWKFARVVSLVGGAAVAASIIFGVAGFLLYSRNAMAAGAGIISREEYLRAAAPDYEIAELINLELGHKSGLAFGGESGQTLTSRLGATLARTNGGGNVLVFMRHFYYLDAPYIYGDPDASWGTDPVRLQSDEEWNQFFKVNGITWVVRAPDYPASLAPSLERLEKSGELELAVVGNASSFQGNRIRGVREAIRVEILRVKLPNGTSATPTIPRN